MRDKNIESEMLIRLYSDESLRLDTKSVSPSSIFLMVKTLMTTIACWLMSDSELENDLGKAAIMAMVDQSAMFEEWDEDDMNELICQVQKFFFSLEGDERPETPEDKSEVFTDVLATIFLGAGVNVIEQFFHDKASTSAMMALAKLEEINRRARNETMDRDEEDQD